MHLQLKKKKKKPVSLTNAFDETLKIIIDKILTFEAS